MLALYILAVLLALFVVSGVLPRYHAWRDRGVRVEEFESQDRAYLAAQERDAVGVISDFGQPPEGEEAAHLRSWLSARRAEMQRDARSVGKGVNFVAPPPVAGGGRYVPHPYYSDLFDEQSFAELGSSFRLDDLATIRHEVELQHRLRRGDLYNPWAWTRLSFERVIAFPRYVLRRAGFAKTADSTAARLVTVVWSFLVGAAGIGGFVVTLLRLRR